MEDCCGVGFSARRTAGREWRLPFMGDAASSKACPIDGIDFSKFLKYFLF